MSQSFSGIERTVITRYLAEELPELQICRDNEPFLLLPQKTYAVGSDTIVFPYVKKDNPVQFSGSVNVYFYYFNRGLYFLSSIVPVKDAFSISISREMYKIPAQDTDYLAGFSASLDFQAANGAVKIPCVSVKEFPLFVSPAAPSAYKKNEPSFSSLTTVYADLKNAIKFPLCAFLSGYEVKHFAVLGRAEPLTLLYLSEKEALFGGKRNNFPFKTDFTCSFSFRMGIRFVSILCKTADIFENAGILCARCEFTSIKPEDTRFLYEKLYKTVFN